MINKKNSENTIAHKSLKQSVPTHDEERDGNYVEIEVEVQKKKKKKRKRDETKDDTSIHNAKLSKNEQDVNVESLP
jgi:hypothetical protein